MTFHHVLFGFQRNNHGGIKPTASGIFSPVQERCKDNIAVELQHHCEHRWRRQGCTGKLVRSVVEFVLGTRRIFDRPELEQRVFLAVVCGTRSVSAGYESVSADGRIRGVYLIFGAVLRALGFVCAAAVTEGEEIRPAVVARLAFRVDRRRHPARTEPLDRRPVPGGRDIPVLAGGDALRGAGAPQHHAHGARSHRADRRYSGLHGVSGARWQRGDEVCRWNGCIGYQKDSDRKNHAHMSTTNYRTELGMLNVLIWCADYTSVDWFLRLSGLNGN